MHQLRSGKIERYGEPGHLPSGPSDRLPHFIAKQLRQFRLPLSHQFGNAPQQLLALLGARRAPSRKSISRCVQASIQLAPASLRCGTHDGPVVWVPHNLLSHRLIARPADEVTVDQELGVKAHAPFWFISPPPQRRTASSDPFKSLNPKIRRAAVPKVDRVGQRMPTGHPLHSKEGISTKPPPPRSASGKKRRRR